MLRMGKNPNEEKSQTQPETESYSTRSYSPYQSGEALARPSTEAPATPKAQTESETIAREIKDGTLSGFIQIAAPNRWPLFRPHQFGDWHPDRWLGWSGGRECRSFDRHNSWSSKW